MIHGVIERFGGKQCLKFQMKGKCEVTEMIHCVGFPNEQGDFTNQTRRIYYTIITDKDKKIQMINMPLP